MAYLDEAVLEAGGIVLRYGGFYGDPTRRRQRSASGAIRSFATAAA